MNSKVRSSDPGSQENKHSLQSSQNRKQLARSDSLGLGQGQYKIVIGSPEKNNQHFNKNYNNYEYQKTIIQENSAINIDQITENSQYNIIEGQSVYIQSYGNSRAQSYKSNTKQVIVQKDYQEKRNKIQPQYQKNTQINCSRMLEESSVIDQFNFQSHNNGNDDSHFQEVQLPIQVPTKTVAKTSNSDTQNFMKLLGEAMTQNMTKNDKARTHQNQYLHPRTHAKSPEKPLLKVQKQKLIQTKQATKKNPYTNKKVEKIQEQRKNSSQRQKYTKNIELNNHPNPLFNNQNQNSQQQQYYIQQYPINNYNQNHYRTPISPIYPKIQYNQNQNHFQQHPPNIVMVNQIQEIRRDNLYQLQRENSKLAYELHQKQTFIQNLINENNFLKSKEKQLKSLIFDMQQNYKLKEASYQDQIYELNRRNQIIEGQLIKRIQENLSKQRETRLIQLLKKQRVINNVYEQRQRQLLQQNTISDSNFNNSIQIINNLPTQRHFSKNNKINQCKLHFGKEQNQPQDYDTKTVQNKETKNKRQKVSYMNLDQQSPSPSSRQAGLQSSVIRRVKSQQKPFNIQYRHLKEVQIKKS